MKLESGPQAIVRDGSNKCVGLDRQGEKQFLELATAVYQALSATGARARLVAFVEHWRATQPQAVATFEREFEQTIRYYSLEGLVREVVRTTSRLERTYRELWRKFLQVGCSWATGRPAPESTLSQRCSDSRGEDFGSSRSAEQFL